jgi:hypothetical protein
MQLIDYQVFDSIMQVFMETAHQKISFGLQA